MPAFITCVHDVLTSPSCAQVEVTTLINTSYAAGRKANNGRGPAALAGAELMPLYQYVLTQVSLDPR